MTSYEDTHPIEESLELDSSYASYQDWATAILLKPGNLRYYRLKLIEEEREFTEAVEPNHIVEEAGDLVWSTVTEHSLVCKAMDIDYESPTFYSLTFESIAEAGKQNASPQELEEYLRGSVYLFQRKAKLAIWIGDTASPEVKQDYVINVMDALLPAILSTIAQIVKAKTGIGIKEVIAKNIEKLEARILSGDLDKNLRFTEDTP